MLIIRLYHDSRRVIIRPALIVNFSLAPPILSDMNYLLLNAGSSSLKCTLMQAGNPKVIARALADWAGEVIHYEYAGPDGRPHCEKISWKGHAQAVKRVLHDLMHVEPVALRA